MSNIPTSLIPSNGISLDQRAKQQNQAVGASNFDALLSSINTGQNSGTNSSRAVNLSVSNSDPLSGFIEELFNNITRSRNNDFSAERSQALPNTFPFTSAFESTFGTSGPLPAFINEKTAELHLTAAQNQAFQDIAVENKDIVKTPASVQKVAMELQQAGIGYAHTLSQSTEAPKP